MNWGGYSFPSTNLTVQSNGTPVGNEPALNFQNTATATWTVTDNPALGVVDVSVSVSGATPTQLTAVTALVAGNVVYVNSTTNPGQASKAQANVAGTANAIGIVTAATSAGSPASIEATGKYPVLFDVAPVVADNGRAVYVSPGTAGVCTLTLPTVGAGDAAIKQVGIVVGANGATTTPDVMLDFQPVIYL